MAIIYQEKRRLTERFISAIRPLLALFILANAFFLLTVVSVGIKNSAIGGGSIIEGITQSFRLLTQTPAVLFEDLNRYIAAKRADFKYASLNVPHLKIDISPMAWNKLIKKREDALKLGILIKDKDDEVDGIIYVDNKKYKVKLRLKGDWAQDHLSKNKWSLRISVKGGDAIFGMRRFSIQAPENRFFQKEPLLFSHLRKYGIMTPKYMFVRVSLGYHQMGIMALEEHMAKELLESQGRRESVILAFDEQYHWDQMVVNKTLNNGSGNRELSRGINYTNHWNLNFPLRIFGEVNVYKNPKLLNYYKEAIGLMRGYLEGYLPPEDVFDLKLYASYLAVLNAWNVGHGFGFINLRFYYNPVTKLIEPIAFDNMPLERPAKDYSTIKMMQFFRAFFANMYFRKMYLEQLKKVEKDFLNFSNEISEQEQDIIRVLKVDYPRITPLDRDVFRERALYIANYIPPKISSKTIEITKSGYKIDLSRKTMVGFHAFYIQNEGGAYLEYQNLTGYPLIIEKVTAAKVDIPLEDGKRVIPVETHSKHRLKIRLPSYITSPSDIVTTAHVENHPDISFSHTARLYASPVTRVTWNKLKGFNESFAGKADITVLPDRSVIRLPSGKWTIKDDLVTNPRTTVIIEEGTTLNFYPGKGMTVWGNLLIKGSASNRVIFRGFNGAFWKGVRVYNLEGKEKSEIRYANFENINFDSSRTGITGAITIFRGRVEIEDLTAKNIMVEDGLNIIDGHVTMRKLILSNTKSDGVDLDFCTGFLNDLLFEDNFGDGLDISGSQIKLLGLKASGIRDKAVSVGEGSKLYAEDLAINNSGTAVVVKDSSDGEISRVMLKNIKYYDFMAYIKKPEYGPARLVIQEAYSDKAINAIADEYSYLKVNGKVYLGREINVAQLYEKGFMRK